MTVDQNETKKFFTDGKRIDVAPRDWRCVDLFFPVHSPSLFRMVFESLFRPSRPTVWTFYPESTPLPAFCPRSDAVLQLYFAPFLFMPFCRAEVATFPALCPLESVHAVHV